MKRIYDWDARVSLRNQTASDLQALKGRQKLTQTTAKEAAAAADAGIDLIMGNAQNTRAVRAGAPNLFFTAALGLPDYPTETDILSTAFQAMKDGADSIYTARGPHIVELLAREQIPVMCHLGLVPRRSGWIGGLRAVGRTAAEALDLWRAFQRMEDAGAFSVEAEIIPARVLEEISRRTRLVTMSLGSGSGGDVIYLFQNDICGERPERPRHARAFGDLHALHEQMRSERRAALRAFRRSVQENSFPGGAEIALIDEAEHEKFLALLNSQGRA